MLTLHGSVMGGSVPADIDMVNRKTLSRRAPAAYNCAMGCRSAWSVGTPYAAVLRTACAGLLMMAAIHLAACASSPKWVADAPESPTCIPDRLLTWQDFVAKSDRGQRAAETAIRFALAHGDPPRITAIFDPKLSWVRSDFAYAWNPLLVRHAARLLRHEQLHFTISCLLAREANATLQKGGDAKAMLMLVNAVATRMNVQYDTETNHGLDAKKQQEWEDAIQTQLVAGPLNRRNLTGARYGGDYR